MNVNENASVPPSDGPSESSTSDRLQLPQSPRQWWMGQSLSCLAAAPPFGSSLQCAASAVRVC